MNERYALAPFINIRGEREIGLLRITPPIPGKPKGELPREVHVSDVSQPIPKEGRR